MKKKSFYVWAAAALTMLVPNPGRFVYGFILVIEMLYLTLTGILAQTLANKLKLEKLSSAFIYIIEIAATILYREIMIIMQPELMFVLGINIYLIPVSLFMIGYIFTRTEDELGERIHYSMLHMLTFSVYALLFFFLRDLLGYGTFTFFGPKHQMYEKIIIPVDHIGVFSLFASIPGAMIVCGIALYTHVIIRTKLSITKKQEETK